MRPLHVVLLNQYFPPDTAATAGYAALIAKRLAEQHQVTVLAGRPSYDPAKRHPRYIFRREREGNLTIERVGSAAFSRHRMFGRVSNYLSYLLLAALRALCLQPDIVLAMTDPPIEGIVGAAVARLLGRPFVYNVRDLYPDIALAANIVRRRSWTDAWERSHRRALRQAARVIVLGEDMRERLIEKGVDSRRVDVVRDAVTFPEVLPQPDEKIVREIRGAFRFVVIHAGNLGFSGPWLTLVRAAQILAPQGVGLVFIGEGSRKQQVQQFARECPNIRFLPFWPASAVPSVMSAGDLHVVTIRRGLEGMVVPSKMYNLLAHGRPILVVATERAEASRLARQHGFGIVANPDDATEVADSIRIILDAPERFDDMSRCARRLARTYDRDSELRKFVNVVEDVAYNWRQVE